MLHSIPVVAPPAPCFSRSRAAGGPFVVGYAAFGAGDGRPVAHRLLPLNLPVLILDLDSGAAVLTGPRDRATLDGPTGWGRGVSVGLTPRGSAALTGMPLSEISGQTLAVDLPWTEQLAAQPSWSARFAWLDALLRPGRGVPDPVPGTGSAGGPGFSGGPGLLGHAGFSGEPGFSGSPIFSPGAGPADGRGLSAAPRWAPSPAVTAAWWLLQRTARVSEVAAALGVTRRRLERDFRREIGRTPGAVARTARLQRSLTALRCGDPPAAAAASGGFADQSHLTRTMRDAVGLTPAAFRAFVQDVAAGVP